MFRKIVLAVVIVACASLSLSNNARPAFALGPTFGNGSDGPITFSTSTQFNPPVDAVVDSGTSGGSTLTVSSPSGIFQPGQQILIHQTRGSSAGVWELNSVQSYALGNITTNAPLANTYASSGANRAQVLVVPQYSNVTVSASVTVSAKPWNGAVGGVLAFFANGTLTVNGNISGDGAGYAGGTSATSDNVTTGEGTVGPGVNNQRTANGNGGGAAQSGFGSSGGGGNGTAGITGTWGSGGNTVGTPDLTTADFGGGGGAAGRSQGSGVGGAGGGFTFMSFATGTMAGAITSNGNPGQSFVGGDTSAGSGGAGGSILLRTQTANFGSSSIDATGGAGGTAAVTNGNAGGVGRIRVEYCTSISGGFSNPPASVALITCSPGNPGRDHKSDLNGDGYSAADEDTIANCGVVSCSSIITFGTSETRTCKDAGRDCGVPNPPTDESGPARVAVPPATGYGCSVTLDIVPPLTTKNLAKSDVDLDGAVTILDLSKVASWFGNVINVSITDPRWEGDMDGDGVITILDLSAMASNFGRSVANNCKVE
jgi:hypothetical protein